MTYASLARNPGTYLGLATLSLICSAAIGKMPGMEGMAMGLASATFGAAVLWQMIQLVGSMAAKGSSPGCGAILTILAFFSKIPIYVALFSVSNRIGHAAPSCFLAGVLLVYFCLVAWAAAR